MRIMSKCFYISVLILLCLLGKAQNIAGYWQGSLPISWRDSLTVGVFITQTDDTMMVVMDSPDQYEMNIPTSASQWEDSTLTLKVASVGASFTGKLSADGQRIVGTFKQGSKFPLTLERGHERMVLNRPQTPQPPYPYSEEEIAMKDPSGKFNLINGTLTMPAGTPKALLILVTGSGWQNRDEALFGHKPFMVIADYLTRQGYAVFRYDDYPKSIFAKSTTFDFADGVTMILDSFSRRTDLASVPMGLLGHSEGSLVSEIVAARDKRVSFIITMGGVAQDIPEVLLYQVRALNEVAGVLTKEEIDNSVALSNALYQVVVKSKTPQQAKEAASKVWDENAAKLTSEQRERYGFTTEKKRATMAEISSPWMFTFFHFSPKKYLKKVKCPFLALGGEKDLQVDAVVNNALFAKYLKNSHNKYEVILGANHILQPCTKGDVSEYAEIEWTIMPEVLEMMKVWLDKIN